MNKIAGFPYQDSAVGFYRILQPVKHLKREGCVDDSRSLPFTGEQQGQFYTFQDKTYLEMTKDAEVMWSTVVYDTEYILRFLNLRKHNNNKMIYDMDDNYYAVPEDNPTEKDVNLLRSNFEACLRSADGITVSVPSLKKIYEKINPNVYVMKNALDFNLWKYPVKKKRKIRIGWRGALGHKDDLGMIAPAIKAIQNDYDVQFVTLGWEGCEFADERNKWVPLFDFPKKLASLGIDIGVVPLVDSAYNRCKSNLNYLEFSALKIPTVISPVENQKGMTALEANSNYEWYVAIEKLIKDKEYRIKLGEDANAFVKENYNIKNEMKPLAEWMSSLKRRKDLEP